MIKIITISREFGSGGRTIGKEVAEKLGIPCYDKDLIEKIAEETGYAKNILQMKASMHQTVTVLHICLLAGDWTDYLKICCGWSFGILYFSLYEKVLQATGKSMYSTIAQITGAVVNIILDPILIYGWLGCPQLGVRGAAYATIIGQIASALVGLVLHLKANKEIKNSLSYIKPSGRIIKGIYSVCMYLWSVRRNQRALCQCYAHDFRKLYVCRGKYCILGNFSGT